nr:serine protease [uncultured Rhodopila sp.]
MATAALSLARAQAPDGEPSTEVLGRVAPAVLRVVAEGCGTDNSARAGSGFAWQQPGQVVTDLHVVAGCNQISVGYQQLDVRPARVVRVLRRADLALLSVDGAPAVTPLSLAAEPPRAGAAVDVFGFALGQPTRDTHPLRLTFANTEAPSLSDVLPDAERADIRKVGFPALDTQVLRLDGNLLPGHSGAPLIDSAGQVVGVGSGGLERGSVGVGWAIRAQYMSQLLTSTDAWPVAAREALTAFATPLPKDAVDPGVRCGEMAIQQIRELPLAEIAATSDDPQHLEALSEDLVQVKLSSLANNRFAVWTEPQSGAGVVLPGRLLPRPDADFCSVASFVPSIRYLVRIVPIAGPSGSREWADAVSAQMRRSFAIIEQAIGAPVRTEPRSEFRSRRWLDGALILRRMFHATGPDGHPVRLYRTDMAGRGAYIMSVVLNDDAVPPDRLSEKARDAWARGVFGVHLTAFPPSSTVDATPVEPQE